MRKSGVERVTAPLRVPWRCGGFPGGRGGKREPHRSGARLFRWSGVQSGGTPAVSLTQPGVAARGPWGGVPSDDGRRHSRVTRVAATVPGRVSRHGAGLARRLSGSARACRRAAHCRGWAGLGAPPPGAWGFMGPTPAHPSPKALCDPTPFARSKKIPEKFWSQKAAPPSYFRRDPPENSQDKKGVSLCRGWHTARWFPPACMWYGL